MKLFILLNIVICHCILQVMSKPEEGGEAGENVGGENAPEAGENTPETGANAPEAGEKPPEAGAKAPEAGENEVGGENAVEGGEHKTEVEDGKKQEEDGKNEVEDVEKNEVDEKTTPGGGTEQESEETTPKGDQPMEEANLTLEPDATTPKNVAMDRYGNPIMTTEILNFTLAKGGGVKVYSELWKTYYTKPATCLCVSRAPLPNLKLYGNLHFRKIKVIPPRYVTLSTEPPATACPPCICPRCQH